MSWQAYIDQMCSCKVGMSGICGKNGSLWATSPNFHPSPDEISVLAEAIRNKDQNIFSTGVRLSGKRWTVIRLEPDSDVLVLKGKDTDNNKQNMVVAASLQALIMGANVDDDVPAGCVRVSVEGLRDYLKSVKY